MAHAASPRPEAPAKAYTVTVVERYNTPIVERGMTDHAVQRVIGEPSRRLDRHTWVYHYFRALPERLPVGDDCHTLLVVFTEGKVSDLKLINPSAQKIIASNLQARFVERAVATK